MTEVLPVTTLMELVRKKRIIRASRFPLRIASILAMPVHSARSQMAEGLLRHNAGDRLEAFSAGTRPSQVRPAAIAGI